MPHIAINLYPGRDMEVKRDMAEKVKHMFIEDFGFSLGDISVSVVEIGPEKFTEVINNIYDKEDLYISSNYIK